MIFSSSMFLFLGQESIFLKRALKALIQVKFKYMSMWCTLGFTYIVPNCTVI